jgi:hypothetical protein
MFFCFLLIFLIVFEIEIEIFIINERIIGLIQEGLRGGTKIK